ncbi:tRNA 5-methoxyuridine(34)/uridine 5-oxyacetic acid(34) synthase CmoB [Thiorhodococcus mannitoliphagus]|uniref:tRNA U34 carboxymethyltransferase n=1 Tax=Thiorhodococcus mannitoliphagus TaxID=329406 RepID=A0A6P1DVV9_9GAMM|nr:tRNA 5-methoxyuridine(34)/uridine 5-oxyacetic acid(34) synthase CmoB [Thiorhodococcus mannitoliphagus]NEX20232.1 tRNA 5-methoxyuridine(34)/uridine 5-oxyacetic acid(34) synthase CmoB [Thiorhodococcus mannitoliphagus]
MDLRIFQPFLEQLSRTPLAPWRADLAKAVERRLGPGAHGDLPRWEAAVAALPELPGGSVTLDQPCVGLCSAASVDAATESRLRDALMGLHPWRKGPFCLHGVRIDTEWRSDLKWDRLAGAISPLDGRLVLDVGCGNGYHAWRMLGAGAELILGVDPTLVFVVQFQAINAYLGQDRLSVLPLGIEDLPGDLTGLDTVFSMGVLYHRRSPMDHLAELQRLLRPGGELVLETLVLEDSGQQLLVPPGRYASMRNVWFIPTVDALAVWLRRCGFKGVEVVDVTRTSVQEQRATDWMRFQSLADHLDPQDPSRTLEGHPAPTRAILIATKP